MQFKVPVTIVLGRQQGELTCCVIEGKNINFVKLTEEISHLPRELLDEISELAVSDDTIHGHIAITSFGHSTIKAVDVGSSGGTCYVTRAGEISPLPTLVLKKSMILSKDFGKWVNVLSLPIFLRNILRFNDTGSLVLTPSRLGENLHITIGYSDPNTIRLLKYFLTRVRQLEGVSMVTASCISRIPQMPLEISVIKEDKYLLFRTYLNSSAQYHTRFKLLLVIAAGGNVIKRYIAENIDEKSLELVDQAVEEFIKITS